jgi:outer membrane immunogenic protein
MKFNTIGGLAVSALLIAAPLSIASAADMAVKAPPAAPPPSCIWCGFYIGANAGGAWGADPTVGFSPGNPAALSLGSIIQSGPISLGGTNSSAVGGFQLGYNWQFNQAWLVGIETDFDLSNFRSAGASTTLAGGSFLQTASEQVNWFGTARARLGYLPTNNLLVYGTGGLAYGKISQSATNSNTSGVPVTGSDGTCIQLTTCYSGASTTIGVGWTAGAGLEYAFWNKWTVRAEYLYVDLGAHSFSETPASAGVGGSLAVRFSDTAFQVVRAGLNYKF